MSDQSSEIQGPTRELTADLQAMLEREKSVTQCCSLLSNFTSFDSSIKKVAAIVRTMCPCQSLGIRLKSEDGGFPMAVYENIPSAYIGPTERRLGIRCAFPGAPIKLACLCGTLALPPSQRPPLPAGLVAGTDGELVINESRNVDIRALPPLCCCFRGTCFKLFRSIFLCPIAAPGAGVLGVIVALDQEPNKFADKHMIDSVKTVAAAIGTSFRNCLEHEEARAALGASLNLIASSESSMSPATSFGSLLSLSPADSPSRRHPTDLSTSLPSSPLATSLPVARRTRDVEDLVRAQARPERPPSHLSVDIAELKAARKSPLISGSPLMQPAKNPARVGSALRPLAKPSPASFGLTGVSRGKKLGAGLFGPVFSGRWSGADVALRPVDSEVMLSLKRLFVLRHPNVLQSFGTVTIDSQPHLIQERVTGSLASLFAARQIPKTSDLRYELAIGAAIGMQFLSENNVVHGSLNLRSLMFVLADGRYQVKVSDYGLVSLFFPGRVPVSLARWSSPEVLESGAPDLPSGVWSFGVATWQIYADGATPFSDRTDEEAATAIKGGMKPPRLPGCDAALFEVMELCWRDPASRPSFNDLSSKINDLLLAQHQEVDGALGEGHYTQQESVSLPATEKQPRKRGNSSMVCILI